MGIFTYQQNDGHILNMSTGQIYPNKQSMLNDLICNGCNKQVNGGEYIIGVFYCPMCASVIHKNNNDSKNDPKIYALPKGDTNNKACNGCKNNSKNGGSGICQCILGQKVFY